MAITTADIHAAADALVAEGKSPTLANVRKALGGGSFSTISEGMAEWRERQAAQPAPMQEPPPAAVADKFNGLLAEVWGAALGMANARLAAEREALDAARIELERDRQEAAELAEQVSADLEQTRQERDRVTKELDAALSVGVEQSQQLAQLTAEVASAQGRAALAEQRADDNAKRADDLSRALQVEQANARSERDQATQQLKEVAQATQAAQAQAADAKEKQAALRGQLEAVQGELQSERDRGRDLAQAIEQRALEAGRWHEEQHRMIAALQAVIAAFGSSEHYNQERSPVQASTLYAVHQVLGVPVPGAEIPQKSGKTAAEHQGSKKK